MYGTHFDFCSVLNHGMPFAKAQQVGIALDLAIIFGAINSSELKAQCVERGITLEDHYQNTLTRLRGVP